MPASKVITSGLGLVLDAFATRIGLGICIATLLIAGLWAGLQVEQAAEDLEDSLSFFQESQRRNGFVAISDLQRLSNIASKGWTRGGFTEEARQEFLAAVDILYVRTDHFSRVLSRETSTNTGQRAVETLKEIIDLADAAVANNFMDPGGLFIALQARQEKARSHLIDFLEDMDRLQDMVLEDQSFAIQRQRSVVFASFGALIFVAALAFSLLRREVLARKAHEIAEREVEFLAYFDPLTRLANRAQFQKRLNDLLSRPEPVALLLLDLDNFKSTNDTHGHAAGDKVLMTVASIIQNAAAKYDNGFAARLGGDEFAIVLPEATLGEMRMLCDRLIEECAVDIPFEGEMLRCGVSIGLATTAQLGNGISRSVDSLNRVTDFALYAAKNAGRGRYEFYNEGLERKYLERRAMIEELPEAIRTGALEIYLQPQVTLPERRVYGFEALVRWNRAGKLVPPDQFISVAEESGVILQLDRFVLDRATEVVAGINRDFEQDFTVSVNLSALHFSGDRIVYWVQDALQNTGLPAGLLTLEITESMEIGDWARAQFVVDQLRDSGARVSIDDFGAGYSSIGYLHAIPADELKIDRSLVIQVETSDRSRFLIDTVIDMATNLKLDVVVEGIETDSQARAIHDLGARQAQGYLFGKPMPEVAIRALLSNDPAQTTPRAAG